MQFYITGFCLIRRSKKGTVVYLELYRYILLILAGATRNYQFAYEKSVLLAAKLCVLFYVLLRDRIKKLIPFWFRKSCMGVTIFHCTVLVERNIGWWCNAIWPAMLPDLQGPVVVRDSSSHRKTRKRRSCKGKLENGALRGATDSVQEPVCEQSSACKKLSPEFKIFLKNLFTISHSQRVLFISDFCSEQQQNQANP